MIGKTTILSMSNSPFLAVRVTHFIRVWYVYQVKSTGDLDKNKKLAENS